MAVEELKVDFECYNNDESYYNDLKIAAEKLFTASEAQFEEIKKEKWYNRLWDLVTFSQKGKKRLAEQISTVSQAQQILMEILVRLSDRDKKVSDLVVTCYNNIKQLQEQDTYLFERITELENSCILGIKKSADIADLSEKNKQILSGCLHYLMNYYIDKNISDCQKQYANSVLNYIDSDATIENISEALSEMDNNSKKKILTCCMEYIFLNNVQMDIPEDLNEFIGYFDFGNKTISSIKQQIDATNNLRGIDGIIYKYDRNVFEDFSDDFYVDIDGINDDDEQEHISDDSPDDPDLYEEDTEDEPDELSEITLSSIIQVKEGEELIFSYNIIHIKTYINCSGKLIFRNCVIYYDEDENINNIKLEETSNIGLFNCIIIGGNNCNDCLIDGSAANVWIENCSFERCQRFLDLSVYEGFLMNSCYLHDCNNAFDIGYPWDKYGLIDNCIIFGENISPQPLFSGNVELTNDTIIAKNNENEKYTWIFRRGWSSLEVKKCTFISAYGCIEKCNKVINSQFKKCRKVLSFSNYDKKGIVDNCAFEQCQDIIELNQDGSYKKVTIQYSQFLNCISPCITSKDSYLGDKNTSACHIDYCEFINTSHGNDKAVISLTRGPGKKSERNLISNCIFNGVDLNKEYLIEPKTAKDKSKPYDVVISVDDCGFLNCVSQVGLIKKQIKYDKLFKTNLDFDAVYTCRCKGLENLNKGAYKADPEQYVVKETNTSGELIGSEMSRIYSEDQLMDPVANNVPIGAYKLIQSFGEFK